MMGIIGICGIGYGLSIATLSAACFPYLAAPEGPWFAVWLYVFDF
jgi:hypothetical protein